MSFYLNEELLESIYEEGLEMGMSEEEATDYAYEVLLGEFM